MDQVNVGGLHPQDAAEVFVDFFGSLTLTAASEKAIGRRECVGAKDQLVLLSSAKGASLPVKFSTHGSDSSDLFVHKTSGEIERNGAAVPAGWSSCEW